MSDKYDDIDNKSDDDDGRDKITDEHLLLSFIEDRHTDRIEGIDCGTQTWRMKERMKTVSVALVLCLNVGVDPPDVMKTQPCARLECWIDPLSMSASKALEKIGANLQAQYERWQPRARYKQSLDPTSEEVKKLCISLRRNAKEERVLFHYNGHGVPKPTANGEIWVFNRTYTQYIPLSIYDLQAWMGAPSIYIYDCSNAGIIIESFKTFAAQHESEAKQNDPNASAPKYEDCIQLAACAANQVLPMNPDLPADLFTSCLTTPIKVALRWFFLKSTSKLVPKLTMDLIDKIPGQITDRRTMLGELNWIFTAITDTIAWNVLPKELFQKLFRQDLLVASLFRNFLLAERIMKSCDCTPISSPALPPTYQHSMWKAWDLALDLSLNQLPDVILSKRPFLHLPFFEEQLTAFQVWLDLVSSIGCEQRQPPEQLPIVLQVLLSQVHRVRALELLGKFLDLGPWAVNLALSVGIFPYVLKLLQSSAQELRPLLVFIWAKILAVDSTCQTDLVRDNGHKYFLSVLQDGTLSSKCRMHAAFVLASIVHNFHDGQDVTLHDSIIPLCLDQLHDPYPELRKWIAICLGRLWNHYGKARWCGVRDNAYEQLWNKLKDPYPEVRAACAYALGTFVNSMSERCDQNNRIDHLVAITLVKEIALEMCCVVRKEMVTALQWFLLSFDDIYQNLTMNRFTHYTLKDIVRGLQGPILQRSPSRNDEDFPKPMKRVPSNISINTVIEHLFAWNTQNSSSNSLSLPYLGMYVKIIRLLCTLENDPSPDVASMAHTVTGHIKTLIEERLNTMDTSNKTNSSLSLPPSPNRSANYLSGDSPPTLNSSPEMHKYTRSTIARTSIRSNDLPPQTARVPLIKTEFVEWSAKKFAQPARGDLLRNDDFESRLYYERDWRLTRNSNIRKEGREEQKRVPYSKLDTQIFNTRTAVAPTLLQFHPFDQQIAVTGKDSFGIWDWGTGAKTTVCQNHGKARITALKWLNGHDVAMLMVATDDGSIRLWRPNTGISREPTLITAFGAFSDLSPPTCDVLLAWEQWTQTIITTGDNRFIRLWDVCSERFAMHIPFGGTTVETYCTAIDSTFNDVAHERLSLREYDWRDISLEDEEKSEMALTQSRITMGLLVVGSNDGTVRVYDKRAPGEVTRWREHKSRVLGVQLNTKTIISASTSGDIKIYDLRKNTVLRSWQTTQNGISRFAVHRNADILACGSHYENVNIHMTSGVPLNTLKIYEGFMGHRSGHVACLDFHPHKVALALGTSDCSVGIYTLDSTRR